MEIRTYDTARYRLEIELDDEVRRIILTDKYSGVRFADSQYRYSAYAESGSRIAHLEGLVNAGLTEEPWHRGGNRISISGTLAGGDPNTQIGIHHRLYIPLAEEYLEERIILRNLGSERVILRGYRFGFRKRLERPKQYGGPGIDIENYRLIAIPFRLQPDGKKHDYQLDDIYHGRYECSEFYNPARLVQEVVDKNRGRSEGWAWTDGENGLLITKYNDDKIEFSMLDTERRNGEVYLTFGGASPSLYNEPIEARVLEPGEEITFGKTRLHFYEGLWRQGSYIFREFMAALGHTIPDNYDPPINWNELYEIGWYHNDREKLARHYTFEALCEEAEKARDMGCNLLYLDPGWEVCEGSTTWDEERLGDVKTFVEHIKQEYGLRVGFRTIGRSYCDDYPGMYRRRADGSLGYYAPYHAKPFYETCVCCARYQEEKLRRILKMADAGMSFIMFDEFDWRGPCYDESHGHPVPTTPNMHAHAVMDLIRRVHERHPEIIIEAHDPIWPWGVRYLPVYYLHGQDHSFDEIWGFEFMWNPLDDLLSGRALSLFYYNLAYDLPLYLHINMDNDNDNCLAFWWYASTCRHLGIGGKKDNERRYRAYKQAMAEYLLLKDLYSRGIFYGIDELTHIHVLPEAGRCVVNAFNLTDTPISRKVDIRLNDLGLLEEVTVTGAPHEFVRGRLVLQLDIPPFSPKLIRLFARTD
jgi:hypothetical protein